MKKNYRFISLALIFAVAVPAVFARGTRDTSSGGGGGGGY
jgi:hypothetical protein